VDAATGDVLYQQAGTGYLLETGTVLARGTYHHYRLSIDFAQKTYSVLVDGNLVRTEGFVDTTATRLTDAPVATLAATADSTATATGTAFFDNYRIVQTQPPSGAASATTSRAGISGNLSVGTPRTPRTPYAPPAASKPAAAEGNASRGRMQLQQQDTRRFLRRAGTGAPPPTMRLPRSPQLVAVTRRT
jgi:hypothetical protein